MTNKPTIIITGTRGQIGSELNYLWKGNSTLNCHFLSRQDLDISNETQLEKFLDELKPDYFVNCAAYTAVDKAESEIEECFLINEFAVGLIAKLCAYRGVKLIHFSSDYVYHINKETPLLETDPTLARGIYAQSKLAGEQLILASPVDYIVIRTSWVYSSFGKNFVKTVIRLAKERDEMSVVMDQIGTLSYARDLANLVDAIIRRPDASIWNQTYNYSNEGKSSWFEIAQFIVEKLDLQLKIKAIRTSEYHTAAERPNWSLMSKDKIRKHLNISIPSWRISLEKALPLFDK